MPHKCTNCGKTYKNGSDDVLSGCKCGSRKFEFIKEESEDDGIIVADEEPVENPVQHNARSSIVSDEDIPDTPKSPSTITQEREDNTIEKVKEELHEQFEGIRIVKPGQYKLNLMKLYEEKDAIISLQEDGRYIINVPGMMDTKDTDRGE